MQVQGMRNDGVVLSRPRILNEASRIIREEGVRAFWKGNGVTVVHRLPYSAVSFFAYEEYKLVSKAKMRGLVTLLHSAFCDNFHHLMYGVKILCLYKKLLS
jgi:hypothetical protein